MQSRSVRRPVHVDHGERSIDLDSDGIDNERVYINRAVVRKGHVRSWLTPALSYLRRARKLSWDKPRSAAIRGLGRVGEKAASTLADFCAAQHVRDWPYPARPGRKGHRDPYIRIQVFTMNDDHPVRAILDRISNPRRARIIQFDGTRALGHRQRQQSYRRVRERSAVRCIRLRLMRTIKSTGRLPR